MSRYKENIARIELVAEGLKELANDAIFIGGASVQFYVPNPDLMDFRSTEDVDCVVRITTSVEFGLTSDRLRQLGFRNDMSGGPIVRWIYNRIVVDIIPDECSIVGYRDIPWFREGRRHAVEKTLPSGRKIQILSLAYYLATKLEASKDRGGGNYLNDHDIEDIISIIDGNEDLKEIEFAAENVKHFIQTEFARLLKNAEFASSIAGHIGFESSAAKRAASVVLKMKRTYEIV